MGGIIGVKGGIKRAGRGVLRLILGRLMKRLAF
jgi:hypothetical protein